MSCESRIVLVCKCVRNVSTREGEFSCEKGRVFLGGGRHVLKGGPSFREGQCHSRRRVLWAVGVSLWVGSVLYCGACPLGGGPVLVYGA